ncbi:TolB family protein [Gracilimonas tropica]|uniref:TolB family protein n=1 Tax=Gracilimonas tropica TaxID=454600 RepID=UPI000362C8DD|nr:PD40 domain-containing protein [Gracilimonas tropica]
MKSFFFFSFFLFVFSCQVSAQERVFFSSFSPETWEVYLSEDDGKTFKPITDHPALDYDAVISPDEKWVVFTSERSGVPQLYVKPLDGSEPARKLINSPSFQDQAAFSPDGSKLAFVGSHEGNAEIYLIDFLPETTLDISRAKNITEHPGGDFRPNFSPDGKHVAFSSDRGHAIRPHRAFPFAMDRIGDIYTLNLQTNELKRLTEEDEWDGSPVWSKTGEEIYFYSLRHGNQASVFKMNSDGSSQQLLSDTTHLGISPVLISDDRLSYTTLNRRDDRVYNLVLDINSGRLDTLYKGELDLFNLHRSPSGLWVAHGAVTAKEIPSNRGGFAGGLIGAGFPNVWNGDSLNVELTAIRRAFAAPPDPNGPFLIFDSMNQGDPLQFFQEYATPFIWPFLLLVVLLIFMVFRGFYLGFRNRKEEKVSKFILAGLGVLFAFIVISAIFFNFFLINFESFDLMLPIMAAFMVIFALIGITFNKKSNRLKTSAPARSALYKYLTVSFALLGGLAFYLAFFSTNMVQTQPELVRVNYKTLETETLDVLDRNYGVHPAFSTVIDMKFMKDGSGLLITTGPFRGGEGTKATVWQYDLDSNEQIRRTDSDHNSGFGDLSLSNKTFVFRSNRDGDQDIFVEESGSLINLTNNPARDNFPVISPDGNTIIYVSDQNGKDVGQGIKTMDLYIIERTGDGWSVPEQLTYNQGQTGHPYFSPDGEWIMYTSEAYGINDEQPISQSFIFSPQMYGEIVALRLKDQKRVRVTHNKWEEGAPIWVKAIE